MSLSLVQLCPLLLRDGVANEAPVVEHIDVLLPTFDGDDRIRTAPHLFGLIGEPSPTVFGAGIAPKSASIVEGE